MTTYDDLLAGKQQVARPTGIDSIDVGEIHPLLKPHQRDAVAWAIRGGRRALFESFGLGKTVQQLEICRLITQHTSGRALIICPLGVRQEFRRDAEMLGVEARFIRTTAEASTTGIHLTNYESVREGKLDPRGFDVVSLDEAAILRGFGGTKTFREMMRLYEGSAASWHRVDRSEAHRIVFVEPGTLTLVFVGRKRGSWGFFDDGRWVDYRDALRLRPVEGVSG